MADEIEKAIIASTDAYTPYHVRSMAINQLIEFAETPEGWKTFVQKLFETSTFEVALYCISTLAEFASKRYSDLSTDEKNQLKEALFNFIFQKSTLSTQDAIVKKMSLTIVNIFKCEFPDEWSTFFEDISTFLLSTSDSIVISKDLDQINPQSLPPYEFVLMFLNILITIDQEVTSSEMSQSPNDNVRITVTRIKDAMREIAVPKLVDIWYSILVLYHEHNVEISKMCLYVIKLYISWIDIRLVVNNLFLPLLVKLISKKEYSSGVIECLYEILLKGMPDPRSKLELIGSLHVPELLLSLTFDEDDSLQISASRVVGVMGTELLQCINKISYQIDQEPMLQNEVKELLDNSLQLLFTYFNSDNDEASQNLLQFSLMYLNYLRKLKESHSNQLSDSALEHLNILLQILFRKCKYHKISNETFDFQNDDIDDEDFAIYRKDLNKLFLSITTINPDLVAGFIASLIQNINEIQDPLELEVIMHFFFLIGECVQEKISSNAIFFAEMIELLATSHVISYEQPYFVHTAFFEVAGRYASQITSKPNLLPTILQIWVEQPGILYLYERSRERHCYLFTRFVKTLKDALQPYLETIVNHLKGLTVFTPESYEILGRQEQIDLFESISFLVGSNKTATEVHRQYLDLLVTPLIDNIKEIMSKEMYINNIDILLWLKGLIMAIATFAKGFPLQIQGGERIVRSPEAVSFFTDALDIISKVLSILYENYDIKESCAFFVSKIIVSVPYENYSPYFENILENLITPLNIPNMICGVKLFLQFITIASSKGYEIIDKIFMSFVLRFVEVINKNEPLVSPKSEEERELQEVKNLYYNFLYHVIMSKDTNVLISATNIGHLNEVLQTLLIGCTTYSDMNIQKLSFLIFKCLVEQWSKKDGLEGFANFLYQELVPKLFEVPLNKEFSLEDGRTNEILTEISNLEQTIYECRGEEFQVYLSNYLTSTLKADQDHINVYIGSLCQKEPKQFRKTKRNFFRNHLKSF